MTFDVIDIDITDNIDNISGMVYRVVDMVFNCFKTFLSGLNIPYLNMSLFDVVFMVLIMFVLFKFLVWALREGM